MAAMCSEPIVGGQGEPPLCSDAVIGAGEVNRYYRPEAVDRLAIEFARKGI